MLQAVVATDLKLNEPLPFSVYDSKAQLLAKAGQVIAEPSQLETLQRIGMRYPANWLTRPSPAAAPRKRVSGTKLQQGATERPAVSPAPPPAPPAPRAVSKAPTFSQFKLLPGTLVQIDGASGRARDTVRLLGWVEKQGLILSSLNTQNTMLPFRDGENLQIKAMAAQDVIAFAVTIEKVLFTPFPAIYTSWPERIEVKRLRQALRVDTELICSVILPEGSRESGRIINLSAHGALLACTGALPAWINDLHLSFRVPAGGQDHVIRLHAQIRNRLQSDDGWQYGLEFDTPTMAESLLLENYILSSLLNH